MQKQEINNLIFKELLKRGHVIEGNTRIWNIADSKLWYLTPKQAKAYLELEKSKEYSDRMFDAEIELLKKYMPVIANKILHGSAINIIDIGCGDGKKAVIPVGVLYAKTKIRYCPVDISGYMINKAIEKIKKLNKGEIVNFRWNISDFDNLQNVSSLLRDEEYRQNLLLFLGSTISNFEIHEVLYEISEAMNRGEDYLLLGVGLKLPKSFDIIKLYKTKISDDFLSLVLTQIGFSKKEIEFNVRYNNSRIECFYTLKKDKRLVFGNKELNFKKGDQILVAFSYRYSPQELKNILKIYFDECKFYFDEKKTWAIVLCRK